MAVLLYPNAGAIQIALTMQTYLASSVLKLFQNPLTLSVSTVKADLTAAVATFTGYSAATVTAWDGPFYDPNGGASLTTGTQFFAVGSTPTVTNTIYGWWIEDEAGNLVVCGSFDAGIDMSVEYDAIPLSITLNWGAN